MISHSQEEQIVICHDEVGQTVDTVVCDDDKSPPLAQVNSSLNVNTKSLPKLNKRFLFAILAMATSKLMINFL